MNRILPLAAALALGACSMSADQRAQLVDNAKADAKTAAIVAGQLFCAVQLAGGGTAVVGWRWTSTAMRRDCAWAVAMEAKWCCRRAPS